MARRTNVAAVAPTTPNAHPTATREVNTRLVAGGAKVTSKVTIVFDSPEITQEFAMRGAVIAWQALCRDAGDIPREATLTISELKKRGASRGNAKPTASNTLARMARLGDEEYREMLQALGLGKAEVEKLVKARNGK